MTSYVYDGQAVSGHKKSTVKVIPSECEKLKLELRDLENVTIPYLELLLKFHLGVDSVTEHYVNESLERYNWICYNRRKWTYNHSIVKEHDIYLSEKKELLILLNLALWAWEPGEHFNERNNHKKICPSFKLWKYHYETRIKDHMPKEEYMDSKKINKESIACKDTFFYQKRYRIIKDYYSCVLLYSLGFMKRDQLFFSDIRNHWIQLMKEQEYNIEQHYDVEHNKEEELEIFYRYLNLLIYAFELQQHTITKAGLQDTMLYRSFAQYHMINPKILNFNNKKK